VFFFFFFHEIFLAIFNGYYYRVGRLIAHDFTVSHGVP